ncbi:MAG: hypothetical protein Q7S40_08520 [Opitutaceae bacterium]|nr:hypothetical protein [Opitutaceae bacterium]
MTTNGWQILVSCADATLGGSTEQTEITLNIVDGFDDGTPPPHPHLAGLINHDGHPDDTIGVREYVCI